MANGDPIFVNSYREYQIKFLDAQDVTANGVWRDVSTYPDRSFSCDAIEVGGKVDIMVSNASGDTPPAGATDGEIALTLQNGGPLSGVVNGRYRWIKAKKTQGNAPAATTCIMVATRNL